MAELNLTPETNKRIVDALYILQDLSRPIEQRKAEVYNLIRHYEEKDYSADCRVPEMLRHSLRMVDEEEGRRAVNDRYSKFLSKQEFKEKHGFWPD